MKTPTLYGLIGKKLDHSFSASFFNSKFKKEKINSEYRLFPIENIDDLQFLINKFPNLKGLNVTVPYKQTVIPFISCLSDEAHEIGAVNVIKIQREKQKIRLLGFNTDAIGFKNSLLPLINSDIKQALVLGTGGASKAVSYVLNMLGIKINSVSRTSAPHIITYQDLTKKIISENLLIINTTPLGMYPEINTCPDIPYQYLTSKHICYDLVYNPELTKFLALSEQYGARIKNGMEMLYLQAEASWEIWKD